MTWAPFSIVGEEIQRISGEGEGRGDQTQRYERVAIEDHEPQTEVIELYVSRMSISSSVPPFSADDIEAAEGNSSNNELSGV